MAIDWQITATTIYCDAVDDEVTVQINKDWSAACSGYHRYWQPSKDVVKEMERKSRRLNRKLRCEGLDCHRVTGYQQKLMAEESGKGTGGK